MLSPVSSSPKQQQQFNGLLTYASNSTSSTNLNNLQEDIIDDVLDNVNQNKKINNYQQAPQLQPYKTLSINTEDSVIINNSSSNSPHHHATSISPASTITTTTSEINNIDLSEKKNHVTNISNETLTENQNSLKNYKKPIKTNVSVIM